MKGFFLVLAAMAALLVACGGGSDSGGNGAQRATGSTAGSPETRTTQPPAGTGSQSGSGAGTATSTAVKLSGIVTGDMRVAGLTCQPNDAANVLVSISGNVGQGQYTIGLSAPGRGNHQAAPNTSITATESAPGFKVWAVGGQITGTGSVEVAQNMRAGRFQGQLIAGSGATGTLSVEGSWTCP